MRRFWIALLCAGLGCAATVAPAAESAASLGDIAIEARDVATIAAQAEARPDVRGLVVLRHGHVVFEYQRSGQDREALQPLESVTKSVLSLLVGVAVAQGRIAGVDQPVLALLPQLADANDDPRARQLSVRHLLTMTTGFQAGERRSFDARDRARFAFGRRFETDPGTRFRYDNPAADLLAAVLAQAVGDTLAAFAQRELFAPLGIEASDWLRDEQGHPLGYSGLRLRTRDMARIGQLMLQGGRWNGRSVVGEDFVSAATVRQNAGGAPVGLPYGYLWWVAPSQAPRPAFVASGFGGQFIWVDPALDLVIAASSDTSAASAERSQALDLIRRHIVPALAASQTSMPPR